MRDRDWIGARNGELLRAAATVFDVFITMDRGIEHQQNIVALDIAVVLISAGSNRLRDVEPAIPALNRLLPDVEPGKLYHVSA